MCVDGCAKKSATNKGVFRLCQRDLGVPAILKMRGQHQDISQDAKKLDAAIHERSDAFFLCLIVGGFG
jgi:hypothetical protein